MIDVLFDSIIYINSPATYAGMYLTTKEVKMSKQIIRMNDGRLNVANLFTFARLPAAWAGIGLYLAGYRLAGVIIIALAAWTDFFDGLVARRFNCATDFGREFDPVVDKIFTAFVIVLTVWQFAGSPWLWLLVGVAASELLNALITLHTMSRKGFRLIVTWFGKKGMFAKMTCVTWLLLSTAGTSGFYETAKWIGVVAGVVGIVFGTIAFGQYVRQYQRA